MVPERASQSSELVNGIPSSTEGIPEPMLIDLLMGLFRGAVFHHGGVPENCPLALMGRFPSFPTLIGNVPSVRAEIWEEDECRKLQLLESGDSLNGRNLFTELPFL